MCIHVVHFMYHGCRCVLAETVCMCNDSSSCLLRSAQGLVNSAGRLSHQAVFQTLPDSLQLQTHRLLYKHKDMKTYNSSDRWLELAQTGTSVQR